MEAAGFLRQAQPTTEFVGGHIVRYQTGELEKHLQEGVALKLGRVGPLDYARMLAKIAHSYAVANFGEASFVPCLPEIILGKNDYAPHFVGGDKSGVPLIDEPSILHRVYGQACDLNGEPHLLVAVRLFAFMGMPRYLVVVGKITDGNLEQLRRKPL